MDKRNSELSLADYWFDQAHNLESNFIALTRVNEQLEKDVQRKVEPQPPLERGFWYRRATELQDHYTALKISHKTNESIIKSLRNSRDYWRNSRDYWRSNVRSLNHRINELKHSNEVLNEELVRKGAPPLLDPQFWHNQTASFKDQIATLEQEIEKTSDRNYWRDRTFKLGAQFSVLQSSQKSNEDIAKNLRIDRDYWRNKVGRLNHRILILVVGKKKLEKDLERKEDVEITKEWCQSAGEREDGLDITAGGLKEVNIDSHRQLEAQVKALKTANKKLRQQQTRRIKIDEKIREILNRYPTGTWSLHASGKISEIRMAMGMRVPK